MTVPWVGMEVSNEDKLNKVREEGNLLQVNDYRSTQGKLNMVVAMCKQHRYTSSAMDGYMCTTECILSYSCVITSRHNHHSHFFTYHSMNKD